MPLPVRLLFLLLFTGIFARGQSRYHFYTLGMDKGLSSNFAWAIGQDKYGFIWIGTTNGLNRYDGHNIRQYFHDDKDSFSLPGNIVYWIFTDSAGDIWFACGHQGLVKYNYAKDRFEKLPQYEAVRKTAKFGAPVWRIGADLQNRMYLNCGATMLRYTAAQSKLENLTPLFNGGIAHDGVAMVIPQNKDRLWILTDGGLFFYDLLRNKIRQIPFDKERLGFGLSAMHDGEFVADNELLISMGRSGFVLFNTLTETFSPPPPPFDASVTKAYTETGGVLKDRHGRIWLANSTYGLVEYFPATKKSYLLKAEPSYPYPYLEQEGKGMNAFEDRDGNIWYGTSQRGVVWFQPAQDFIKVYQRNYADPASLADDAVYSFLPAGKEVLIGTGKGVSRLTKEGRIFNYPRSVTAEGVYPAGPIRSFTRRGDTVIMATNFGLSFYNERSGAFKRFIAKDEMHVQPFELLSNTIARVHYTAPGSLILFDFNGYGARFDIKTGRCLTKKTGEATDSLYSFYDVYASALDSARQTLWVEANTRELYAYDLLTKRSTRHFFSGDSLVKAITAITVDGEGQVWLATNDGLFLYDPVGKKSRRYALPTATQNILNVALQKEGPVWATTATEVVKLDAATGKAVAYNLTALLPYLAVYKRSLCVDEEGIAWIGTNKGFCAVDGKAFRSQTYNGTAPSLISFKVFDQPKLFDKPYHDLSAIGLDYNENFFSFDFSALDFSQTAGLQYAYRLSPFDKDWQLTDKNTASYTNVPPGTYTLRLRTQYGLGQWKEAAPVTVYIRSPFWQRWWAVSLMAIAAAFALYGLYRLRQKQRREKRIDDTIDYFANSLYGENSINEICWDIARNCISQLKLDDCVVYLWDEKQSALVPKAAYGLKNPKDHEILNPTVLQLGEGVVGAAAAAAKPVLVKDTSKDSRYRVDVMERLSELAVPIIHDGNVIGVIDSEHPRKNFFGEEHVKVLSTIAAITANKIAEAKAGEAAKESQLQLLEIKKLYAESQLMALRAQMNPHFVFNCLNSIQECIVMQKYGEASLYLNKFAKLFRSVLNNSGKVFVTLAEEIEVLDLYLTLEHMRFEKSFTWSITTDEDLEAEEILVPSMLLQPYVENALWHGLMHKEGDRRLCISFNKKGEDVFECVIEDNGIGRKKALELKEQQSKTKRHVSRGMTISKDRVELLQKQGQHATLAIIDKHDKGGEATGTKVVVELSAFLA